MSHQPIPKVVGVVIKVKKHGSVRCRVLNCSNGSLSLVLCRFSTFPVRRNDPECHHQDRVAPFALSYIYGRRGSFPWPRRILPKAKGWAFLGSGFGPSTDIDMSFPVLYPHNSPSKSCCPAPRTERRVLVSSSLCHGLPSLVLHQCRNLFVCQGHVPGCETFF